MKVQTQLWPFPADDRDFRALNDWCNGSLVVIPFAVIPTHLPDGVVKVDKIDPHMDTTFAGVKVRGRDCTARRCLVKDGGQFLVPSGMRVICALDKLQIVGLEPDSMAGE